MPSRVSRVIVLSLIVLAAIGFGAFLFKEPTRLMQMLLIYGLIIGIFYAIYRIFFRHRATGTDRKYQQAVKQSMKRQKQKQKSRVKAPHLRVIGSNPHKLKTKKPVLMKKTEKHNLTVIEGRKNKKKNRALF